MKIVIHMIATLTILGVIAGGLLAYVDIWSSPLIAENQRRETERAIFLVQPDGKSYKKVDAKGVELYKVFNSENKTIGYSLVYQGNGFQGKIRLMAGLNEDLAHITSIEVLEQSETPGLGTKILEDPFRSQFNKLETSPEVEWVKGSPPTKPNEIQTITGATISSKAVVEIINEGVIKLRSLKEKKGVL